MTSLRGKCKIYENSNPSSLKKLPPSPIYVLYRFRYILHSPPDDHLNDHLTIILMII